MDRSVKIDMLTRVERQQNNRYYSIIPAVVLVVLMLASLVLLNNASQSSIQFEKLYSALLVINAIILIILLVLIGMNFTRLTRQYKEQAIGSQLTVKLVLIFIVISLVPVSIVYYFSLQFLHRGIDSWFNIQTDNALKDAIELSRSSLDLQNRGLVKETEMISRKIVNVSDAVVTLRLDDLMYASFASSLAVMDRTGHIIASDSRNQSAIPGQPNQTILSQLHTGRPYVGLYPEFGKGLSIRVIVPIKSTESLDKRRYLQALYPVSERISKLADNVQDKYAQYQELSFLREPLKYSFILTLSLVLLLSILAAVWAAFISARRLVAPIRALAIGTRAVAEGNYDSRVSMRSTDELGALVDSFNEMTKKIALAHDDVRASQHDAEKERAYLLAVLGSLSSGVITLDRNQIIRTSNKAANQILGAELAHNFNLPISQLGTRYPHLQTLVEALESHLNEGDINWRQEAAILGTSGRQVLMCRGRSLGDLKSGSSGYVIVIDDVTALIQAERDAAWREVARRLAHEIKNPLTPIQLSAERLRHKYLKTMKPEKAELLDRSTHTIIQQVTAMKDMVQAFSDYARMPLLQFEILQLNSLVNEVLDLYRGHDQVTKVQTHLDTKLPLISADPSRIRQLLHNLIKNSFEAVQDKENAKVVINTLVVKEPGAYFFSYVDLIIENTESEIPAQILNDLFEPYVTTKRRGTGLGLAIVKKIVDEHGGIVRAENTPDGKVVVAIRLPISRNRANDDMV